MGIEYAEQGGAAGFDDRLAARLLDQRIVVLGTAARTFARSKPPPIGTGGSRRSKPVNTGSPITLWPRCAMCAPSPRGRSCSHRAIHDSDCCREGRRW